MATHLTHRPGLSTVLQHLLDAGSLKVRLYTNAAPPTPADGFSWFEEPTFAGYEPVTIDEDEGGPLVQAGSMVYWTWPSVQFFTTEDLDPAVVVRGWLVTCELDGGSPEVLFSHHFATPATFEAEGDDVTFPFSLFAGDLASV